jgi:hypothetical protein
VVPLPEKSREKACTEDGVSAWLHRVRGKGAGWWHATGMWKKVKKGRRIRGQRGERERGGGREGEEERERRREENFGQAFSDVTWLLGALYFVRTYSSTTVYCSCSNCSAMVAGAGDLLLAGAVQVEIPTYTLGRLPPSTA